MKFVMCCLMFLYCKANEENDFMENVEEETINETNSQKVYNWKAGTKHSINCVISNKTQKVHLDWLEPSEKEVGHELKSRVYSQEQLTKPDKGHSKTSLYLSFQPANVEDTGVWQCVSSPDNNIKQKFSICVIDQLQYFPHGVKTIEVIAYQGRSISLVCQANGDPAPTFQWYRNQELLTDDNNAKYKTMTKYTTNGLISILTITHIDRHDNGLYVCKATQENAAVNFDCAYTDTKNFTVLVAYAPTFINGNSTIVYGVEGEKKTLKCETDGIPVPNITWYRHDGENLIKEVNGKYNLLLLELNKNIFGQKLSCRAKNQLGDIFQSFLIKEMMKPQKPNNVIVYNITGTDINLMLIWNNKRIYPVQGVEVELINAQNNENSVEATNKFTWNKSKQVTIEANEEENNETLSITLTDLNEDCTYWIRVRVFNKAGFSTWSTPISASTATGFQSIESFSIPSPYFTIFNLPKDDFSILTLIVDVTTAFFPLPHMFFNVFMFVLVNVSKFTLI